MLYKLVLLFVVTPLVELAILIYLGTLIGVMYTILIVVATGLIGAILARHQGLATFSRIRSSIDRGVIPSEELLHGALILVGGLLLLTPGLVTDLVGFAMLIPQTRKIVANWLRRLIQRKIQQNEVHYWEIR
ncbi:MAG: FxsA family protein [Dehalococcoidia bacterium]